MTLYQFLQTWTGRWCLFFVSFVLWVFIVMLGYGLGRETGEAIFWSGFVGEVAALLLLLCGSGTS